MAPLFFFCLLLFHPTTADLINFCDGKNYTINSTFESNLNHLLTSFSTVSTTSTFYNTSIGSDPNKVYGLFLCRGDISHSECHVYIDATSRSLLQLQTCPYSKQVTVWYDTCELRFSDESFFSSFGNDRGTYLLPGSNATSYKPDTYGKYERELMQNLTNRATYNNTKSMFATGRLSFGNNEIYGMVQCTRDLSMDACNRCLHEIILWFWSCCEAQIEGGTFGRSCSFRYGDAQFFYGRPDISTDIVLHDPASPPPAGSLPPVTPSFLKEEDNQRGDKP